MKIFINGRAVKIEHLFPNRPQARFVSHPFSYTRWVSDEPVELKVEEAVGKACSIHGRHFGVNPHHLGKDPVSLPYGSYAMHHGEDEPIFVFIDAPTQSGESKDGMDVTSEGVISDGQDLQTQAIQEVLNKVRRNGGGTVYFPEGVYRTGALYASGNTLIYLAEGAILQGSADPADYLLHEDAIACGLLARKNPVSWSALITFSVGANGGIVGPGIVDGCGHRLREHLLTPDIRELRINLVAAIGCSHFTLSGCTLRDSEFWNTHFFDCENVRVTGVKVLNEIPHRDWNPKVAGIFWNNADGINSDNSRHVVIEDCFIHTGDDCLTLKLTGERGSTDATTHVEMRRCTLCSSTSTMKLGTETRGRAIEKVIFEDNHILPSSTGTVATLSLFDSATIEDVAIRRIVSEASTRFIDFTIRSRREGQVEFGSINNFVISDVAIQPSMGNLLYGHSPEHRISGLEFSNVSIGGKKMEALQDIGIAESPYVDYKIGT